MDDAVVKGESVSGAQLRRAVGQVAAAVAEASVEVLARTPLRACSRLGGVKRRFTALQPSIAARLGTVVCLVGSRRPRLGLGWISARPQIDTWPNLRQTSARPRPDLGQISARSRPSLGLTWEELWRAELIGEQVDQRHKDGQAVRRQVDAC